MSNYPPGVTGNEPQIAGYPERGENVECKNTGVVHFRHEMQETVGDVDEVLGKVFSVEIDCEWEGKVEGDVVGYDFIWTCPRCGNVTEEEDFYAPDPDVDRGDYW